MAGLPPAYLKIGKAVLYDEIELNQFLAACRRQSTSEPDGAEQKIPGLPPAPRAASEPGGSKVAPKLAQPRRANVTKDRRWTPPGTKATVGHQFSASPVRPVRGGS